MTVTRTAPAGTVRTLTPADAAEQHLDDVYGYLLYFVRHREAAEDLTGATFEKALRTWHRFDPARGTARTWLLGIARSTALDWLRSEARRRKREQLAAPPEIVESSLLDGLSPPLQRAVAALSAGEREVLALRVVLELDTETVGRLLGITPSAVSTRLSRALTHLEERLEDDGHE